MGLCVCGLWRAELSDLPSMGLLGRGGVSQSRPERTHASFVKTRNGNVKSGKWGHGAHAFKKKKKREKLKLKET